MKQYMFALLIGLTVLGGSLTACVGSEDDIVMVDGEVAPYDDDIEVTSDALTNGTLRRGGVVVSDRLTGSDAYCLNVYNSGAGVASANVRWLKNGSVVLSEGSTGWFESRSTVRSVVVRPTHPFNRTSWISAEVRLVGGDTAAWRVFPGRVITRADGSRAVDCTR